jgi:hypothetical protein
MQLFPLEQPAPDYPTNTRAPEPASMVRDSGLTAEGGEARQFRVVFRRDAYGPLWKVDAVADHAIAAAQSVAYAEEIPLGMVLGVMDLQTLR